MPVMNQDRPAWVDLSTSDPAGAHAFYTSVFGWQIEVETDPQYGGYAMARADGFDVAGIGPAQPGAPTAWSLYLGTDDAVALGERVAAAGGTMLLDGPAPLAERLRVETPLWREVLAKAGIMPE